MVFWIRCRIEFTPQSVISSQEHKNADIQIDLYSELLAWGIVFGGPGGSGCMLTSRSTSE